MYFLNRFYSDNLLSFDSDSLSLSPSYKIMHTALAMPSLLAEAGVVVGNPVKAPVLPGPLFADIDGDAGNNILNGTASDDTINGLGGNDTINGGGGNDILNGGEGDDIFVVNLPSIQYLGAWDGGAGNDRLLIEGPGYFDLNSTNLSFGNIEEIEFSFGVPGDRTIELYAEEIGGAGLSSTLLIDGANGGGVDLIIIRLDGDSDNTLDLSGWTFIQWNDSEEETITIIGDSDSERITGSSQVDVIQGNGGNDIIEGGAGADTLDGGAGTDTLSYSGSSIGVNVDLSTGILSNGDAAGDIIANFENLTGSSDDDSLSGNSGNNVIIGGAGGDTINGNGGNDVIEGGAGADILDGGAGNDTLSYAGSTASVNVDLTLAAQLNGDATGDIITDFENLTGSGFDDSLAGDDGNNVIIGGAGNDTINGGNGGDNIRGGLGADILDGEAGLDTLNYSTSNAAVIVNLATGSASGGHADGDAISNFENLTGSTGFGDVLTGDGNDNVINGRGGNDTLTSGSGNDTLNGGNGNDTLIGDGGVNVLVGGSGSDTLRISSLSAGNTFDGGSGIDTFTFSTFNNNYIANLSTGVFDVLALGNASILADIENITAGNGDDVLTGNGGANFIDGGGGNDSIIAGEGADTLTSGSGDDTLHGGDGNDTLIGDGGVNVLNGDAGNDILRITDFTAGNIFDGGGGIDTFTFSNLNNGYTVNLSSGVFDQLTLGSASTVANIENITAGNGDDVLVGNSGDNVLNSGDGNDIIDGGEGVDIVNAGTGEDEIVDTEEAGTFSVDAYDGGSGIDLLRSELNWGADAVFNLATGQQIVGADIFDTYANIENLSLGGAASAIGDAGNNVISFVTTDPFANANIVDGGAGDDTIFTNDGNDFVTGGLGADTLDGGNDTDTLNYAGSDAGVTVDLGANTASGGHAAGDIISNFENLEGSAFDDVLTSSLSFGTINGNEGNDTINLTAGQDGSNLNGGEGDDIITSAVSMTGSFLDGGAGNDELYLFTDSNIIGAADAADGGEGDDLIGFRAEIYDQDADGGTGIDTLTLAALSGGYIVDMIIGSVDDGDGQNNATFSNIENIIGSSGNDIITGDELNNEIAGGDGNDTLIGGLGDDNIAGGEGADSFIGGGGADVINGGDGFDNVDYRGASSAVAFNVVTGGTLGDANGDSYLSIELYYASNFNDVITGSGANEFFYGEAGNDTINGGGGIDRIYGGDGNDIQRGQEGNDVLFGSAGSDQLNGGIGFDIASYDNAASRVELNLGNGGSFGDALGDSYFGIEAVYGSDFDDVLTGNNASNELRGGNGDDTLNGGGGNDRLFGGQGADAFNGGSGDDIVNYTLATTGVGIDLILGGFNASATATQSESVGDSYGSIEWVFGSEFSDIILGDDASNRLEGRGGNDQINGGNGDDRILGGDGNDELRGGEGIDTIFGQDGDDNLFGDAGNDFFFGSDGGDSIDGGADFDTVSYLASSSGVTLNLQTGGTGGDAAGDSYTSIERVFGTSHDDSISGSDGDNVLFGNGGSDYLTGGAGTDTLLGGAGTDSFGYDTTGDGSDFINDFFGGETIFILGGDTNFDTFAELQTVASDAGGNVIFDFGGGNTLTVVGRNIADLDAGDFDFGGTPPASQPLQDLDAFASEPLSFDDIIVLHAEHRSAEAAPDMDALI